jgi:transposase
MQHERTGRGIDRAQRVLHAVGRDDPGQGVWRQRGSRHALRPVIAPLPPGRIGMEAGGGAQDGARRFHAPGHEGKRRAPQGVQP